MRNLKKILALVLALVMSLSLMATAGAADTTASGETITPAYQTAIDVLKGVEVFRGYEDGTIRPQNTITRAEVAAILYRIATGDVNDAKVSIYTDMANVNFTDLANANWAKGYINYCANAQLIVGMGDGTFKPQQNITGYATLAMVLRALGYDKNGEFKGSGWEIRTASKARELHILDNVTSDLGAPATRELVSELLFRAILCETVTYSPLNQNLYQETGKTLAKENLKLEEVEGVVVANEWADLDSDSVLAKDKTRMALADGTTRVLEHATDLNDIGESRLAYIQHDNRDDYKVIKIADSGKNTTWEGAEKGAASNIAGGKFSATGMSRTDDTEDFVNFNQKIHNQSEWIIRYTVERQGLTAAQEAYLAAALSEKVTGITTEINTAKTSYTRTFRPETVIPDTDLDIMKEIFYTADRDRDNVETRPVDGYLYGEVYAGTSSLEDKSDIMSWRQFEDKFLTEDEVLVTGSANGEWLKVIDNNDDGKAEYVFLTKFTMDKAINSYKKSGEDLLNYFQLDVEETSVDYLNDVAVGDVVVWFEIDGVTHVWKAVVETDEIRTVNYKNDTVVTAGGETKEQSGIGNATNLQQRIVNMDENTEYNMYLDAFGYVRAYDADNTKYALVTEAYYTNNNASAFVQNWPVTVEITAGDADTAEYNLTNRIINGRTNPFVSSDYWTDAARGNDSRMTQENYLQPATPQLGFLGIGTPSINHQYYWTFWNLNSRFNQRVYIVNDTGRAFDYGQEPITFDDGDRNTHIATLTNVARYDLNDNGVNLYTAAQLRTDKDGKVYSDYAVDYIQLSTAGVNKGQREYDIFNVGTYAKDNNYHVNATHDTEYYIVSENGVYYVKDYTNLPAINASNIRTAYAVARNTSSDVAAEPYWVADVVVYEVQNWETRTLHSIALAYFLSSKTTGDVQYVETLNNKSENADLTMVPASANRFQDEIGWTSWGALNGTGFYKLYDAEMSDENLAVGSLDYIGHGEYNDNGIYAGVIDRMAGLTDRGGYLEIIEMLNVPHQVDRAPVYEIADNGHSVTTLNMFDDSQTPARESDVQKGDAIIWVMNGSKVAYIVDLGPVDDVLALTRTTLGISATKHDWLAKLWVDILDEERNIELTADQKIDYAQKVLAAFNAAYADSDKTDAQMAAFVVELTAAIENLNTIKITDVTAAKWVAIQNLIADLEAAIAKVEGGAPVDPDDPLKDARETANKAIDEYRADEIAALTEQADKDAAEAAKTAAKAAVAAATAEAADEIQKAVDTYKTAIDAILDKDEPTDDVVVTFANAGRTEAFGKTLTMPVPGTTRVVTDGQLVLSSPADFEIIIDPNTPAVTLHLQIVMGDDPNADDAVDCGQYLSEDGSKYVIPVTESTTITYNYYIKVATPDTGDEPENPDEPPIVVTPDPGEEGSQTLALIPSADPTTKVTYYVIAAKGYTLTNNAADKLTNCSELTLVDEDKIPAGIEKMRDELNTKYAGKWTFQVWSFTFELGSGSAWPTEKDFSQTKDVTLAEAVAAAIEKIEAAAEAAGNKPNMNWENREEINAIAKAATDKLNGMTEATATVADVTTLLNSTIAAINAVKPEDVIGTHVIGLPNVYQPSQRIVINYYKENDEHLTNDEIIALVNENTDGIVAKSVTSYVWETLDKDTGEWYQSTNEPGATPNTAIVEVTVDGREVEYIVTLNRMYDIKVNGQHAGWVTRSTETLDDPTGEGYYLPESVLAASSTDYGALVDSKAISGKLQYKYQYQQGSWKNQPLAMTITKVPNYAADPNGTVMKNEYSFGDQNFVTAYEVKAPAKMSVNVAMDGAESKSFVNDGGALTVYAQEDADIYARAGKVAEKGWTVYTIGPVATAEQQVDTIEFVKKDGVPGTYTIKAIDEDVEIGVITEGTLVKIDGVNAGVYKTNTNEVKTTEVGPFVPYYSFNGTSARQDNAWNDTAIEGDGEKISNVKCNAVEDGGEAGWANPDMIVELVPAVKVNKVDGATAKINFKDIAGADLTLTSAAYVAVGAALDFTIAEADPIKDALQVTYTPTDAFGVADSESAEITVVAADSGKVSYKLTEEDGEYSFAPVTMVKAIVLALTTAEAKVVDWQTFASVVKSVNGKDGQTGLKSDSFEVTEVTWTFVGDDGKTTDTETATTEEEITELLKLIKAGTGITVTFTVKADDNYALANDLTVEADEDVTGLTITKSVEDGVLTVTVDYKVTEK